MTGTTSLPIDETSRARLASDGLRMVLVDPTDAAAHAAWFRAETRGFHGAEPSAELVEQRRASARSEDRMVGVLDDTTAMPEVPVATTVCWPAELTVPGGRAVGTWAVSGVTVSPTHRRRGIARALVEAELRTAVAHGLPTATLTVSESTIYSRFGFSPAVLARDVTVQTARARWSGPEPAGRVHAVTAEQLDEVGPQIVERVRLTRPGEVSYGGPLWTRQLGLSVDDENAKNLRFVRHDAPDGTPDGFAIYQLIERGHDFSEHELKLNTLVAVTADAYAALWRFVLEMDLVSTVTAHLRPVDEPLRWLLEDFRAVGVTETDHLWVRVLDVPAALSARTYLSPGRLVLTVSDPLGHAAGTWALDVSPDGTATVTASTDPAEATMTVNALGALYLGGVPARTLAAAGSLHGDVDRVDAIFRSPVAPYLSIWF
ncbi:GNAT family N-acetyltransferase [Aeromicrobium sp. CF4.19]|uniref:GNAT family N-acetyltransferase n=1 Tax=Aeromicrobium sp. CF4.19 TaxID=3373082 RepID=UPI003EE682FE